MITNNYLFNPNAVMLHEKTRHTNIDRPYNRFVAGETFPDQISELLNTEVTLKYRNHNIVDINLDAEPYERPSDDEDYYVREVGPDDFDQIDVYEDKFRVVRADNSEPFVLIGLSKDYSKVLVNSTKKEADGEYRFKTHISRLPQQDNRYFGLDVFNRHTGEIDRISAVTIRVDDNEPTYSVLVEFLGSTNVIRLTLGDETFSHIKDYVDADYDFDARDANYYPDHYADINGLYASHNGLVTMNIDAGRAGNLSRVLFNRDVGNVGIEDLENEVNDDIENDIDFGELVTQDIDYDMNDDTVPSVDYNFCDLQEDDPVIGDDDEVFNFGELTDDDPDIDYDMNDETVKSVDYNFGELEDEPDIDYDMNNDSLPSNDYEFGDIDQPKKVIDYDMNDETVQPTDYDFYDIYYDPDVVGPDDGKFNFGDIDYTDPDYTPEIDYDEPDDCIFNFRDLDFTDSEDQGVPIDDDDGVYNFGDLDCNTEWEYHYDMENDAYYIDYNFRDVDVEPPVKGEDDFTFNFGDLDYDESIYYEPNVIDEIEYTPPVHIIYNEPDDDQVYNFGDLDYDPPVEGDDDGVNNYGDLDEYNFDTGQEWYEEGDPKYIECDFDFGEYTEDESAIIYDFGDLDNPDRVIRPEMDLDLGELEDEPDLDYDMNVIGDLENFTNKDAAILCLSREIYINDHNIKIEPKLYANRDIIAVCIALDMFNEESDYQGMNIRGGIPIDFNFHDTEDDIDWDEDDGIFNFGDIDNPEYPEPNLKDDDDEVLNFGDIDIDPPREEDKMDKDDGVYNFGTLGEDDETANGDYDMNESLDVLYKRNYPELYPEEEVKTNHIRELNRDEVKLFRQMIFEGRTIYGSV